ncbi:MAG: hypothetical protein WBC55_09205 [Dehalococcoidia bacterium]
MRDKKENIERRTRPMVQVKDLTELKIEDLWREVKGDDEDWWGDLKSGDPADGEEAFGECYGRGTAGVPAGGTLPAHRTEVGATATVIGTATCLLNWV